MSEFKGKFNPGYEYLEVSEIRELQLLLDECWSSENKTAAEAARKDFPKKIKSVVNLCLASKERASLMFNFLQKSISLHYAGGMGKDFKNPVIKSIKEAVEDLLKKYPDLMS